MKYKCIKNPEYHLTPGKIYFVKCFTVGRTYLITNDIGYKHFIFAEELYNNFVDIQEVREQKLRQLFDS